jgi:restriction system protein
MSVRISYRSVFDSKAAHIGWVAAADGWEKVHQLWRTGIEPMPGTDAVHLEDLPMLQNSVRSAIQHRLQAHLEHGSRYPIPKPEGRPFTEPRPASVPALEVFAGEEPWPPPPPPDLSAVEAALFPPRSAEAAQAESVSSPQPEPIKWEWRWYERLLDRIVPYVPGRVRAIEERNKADRRAWEERDKRERRQKALAERERDWIEDMRTWEECMSHWVGRFPDVRFDLSRARFYRRDPPPTAAAGRENWHRVIGEFEHLKHAWQAMKAEWQRKQAAWQQREREWQSRRKVHESTDERATRDWADASAGWTAGHSLDVARLAELEKGYQTGNEKGLLAYVGANLNILPQPPWCTFHHDLRFSAGEGILLIDTHLPHFPSLKVEKWRQGKELKRVPATQKETREIVNQLACFLLLRLMWEAVQVDSMQRITLVACNGLVSYDDPATGRAREDVIMSVAAKSSELREILLDRVDPKACFARLHGVVAPRVLDLIPVAPIIWFNKNDSRFVEGKTVLHRIAGTNLAIMDWQEFEHLIRELFERAFTTRGAEVRVTQASRDRGVDAVVFDPDPIKGGKIIIQAKRYSVTVDLSAVRDLYGTIQAEGANKGILVTTSDFGPDAYEFAAGKPITLLNGANLLHLLSEHGYQARIDLQEARTLLRERGENAG